MTDFDNTIWCAGCGAEILQAPYVVNHQNFCCQNCAQGYTCKCGQAMERKEDYRDDDLPLQSHYPGEAYLAIL